MQPKKFYEQFIILVRFFVSFKMLGIIYQIQYFKLKMWLNNKSAWSTHEYCINDAPNSMSSAGQNV